MLVIQNTHFEYSFSVESQCVVRQGEPFCFCFCDEGSKECAQKEIQFNDCTGAKTFSTLGVLAAPCAPSPPCGRWLVLGLSASLFSLRLSLWAHGTLMASVKCFKPVTADSRRAEEGTERRSRWREECKNREAEKASKNTGQKREEFN